MKKNRILGLALAGAMLIGALGACAPPPPPVTPVAPPAQAEGSQRQPAGQQAPAPGTQAQTQVPDDSGEPRIITMGIRCNRQTLDRTRTTNLHIAFITEMVIESFAYENPRTGRLDWLTTYEPVRSDCGTIFDFTIRQGIYFHNGEPFNTEAVRVNFERMLCSVIGTNRIAMMRQIVGAMPFYEGETDVWEGLEIIDDYNFRVTYYENRVGNLTNFAHTHMHAPQALLEAGDDWGFYGGFYGTGPFRVAENNIGVNVIIERNPYYHGHGPTPHVNAVYFRYFTDDATMLLEFEAGQIDLMPVTIDTARNFLATGHMMDSILQIPYASPNFLVWNVGMEPFDNFYVRQAFNYAIDRAAIEEIMGGTWWAGGDMIHPLLMGHDATRPVVEYNPARSRELLESQGITLPLRVYWRITAAEQPQHLAIQQSAIEAGFEVVLERIEAQMLTSMNNAGENDGVQMQQRNINSVEGWGLYGEFIPPMTPARNLRLYTQDRFDRFEYLHGLIQRTWDVDERTVLARELVDIAMEEYWFVILGYANHYVLSRPYISDMTFLYGRPKFIQANINMAERAEFLANLR